MARETQAAQDFVPIKEVRDGVVVLKNGGLRALLMTSSMNLALKSENEHNAIITEFQNYLNSLEFSTQIGIQSRRLDIRPYIVLLETRLKEIEEELLQVQTREYIEFIKWFSDSVSIMTKSFFVVVPYDGAILVPSKSSSSFLGKIGLKSEGTQAEKDFQRFEEQRSQLEQRVAVVKSGLSRLGVRAVQLGTQEVIEVYYKIFNPGETQKGISMEQPPS